MLKVFSRTRLNDRMQLFFWTKKNTRFEHKLVTKKKHTKFATHTNTFFCDPKFLGQHKLRPQVQNMRKVNAKKRIKVQAHDFFFCVCKLFGKTYTCAKCTERKTQQNVLLGFLLKQFESLDCKKFCYNFLLPRRLQKYTTFHLECHN